jgi:hypothetical protein
MNKLVWVIQHIVHYWDCISKTQSLFVVVTFYLKIVSLPIIINKVEFSSLLHNWLNCTCLYIIIIVIVIVIVIIIIIISMCIVI